MSCTPYPLPSRSILRGQSYRPVLAVLRDPQGEPFDFDGAELVLTMADEQEVPVATWRTNPGEGEYQLIWDPVEGLLESEWVRAPAWEPGAYRGHLWAQWADLPPGNAPLLTVTLEVQRSWTDVTGGD